jgi:hypothetical protein
MILAGSTTINPGLPVYSNANAIQIYNLEVQPGAVFANTSKALTVNAVNSATTLSGAFSNSGIANMNNTTVGGRFINSGTTNNTGTTSFEVGALVTNTGTLSFGGDTSITTEEFKNTGGTVNINAGTLSIDAGGSVRSKKQGLRISQINVAPCASLVVEAAAGAPPPTAGAFYNHGGSTITTSAAQSPAEASVFTIAGTFQNIGGVLTNHGTLNNQTRIDNQAD